MRDLPPHQTDSSPTSPRQGRSGPSMTPTVAIVSDHNDTTGPTSPTISNLPATPATDAFPTSRLGMERGYSLSPMYSLILEYNQERGNNLSTAAEVSWLLQKPCLKPQDIEIRDDSDPATAVRVVDIELQPILRVVTELQTFLDRMAHLIQERSTVFRIDPRETMTLALQGCSSRSQLEVAHKILLKRLLVAQQTVIKYEAQYRQTEIPLSPLSTVPELYQEFDTIESVDDRMRFMLNNVPHHQAQIPPNAREALRDGLSWDVISPTQPLPPTSSSLLSTQPLSELPQSQNSQGKKKVDWDDRAPWEGTSTSVERGRDLDEGLEPSFGFQTPFKKGTRFFDSSADGPSSAYFSTPGSMFTPDVTVGLGTPSRTELGQNVRDYSANQGTEAFAMTKRTANTAQATTTTSTTNPFVRSSNPFPTDNHNRAASIPPNRGGGNDPSRSGGPPHPGGGGGGPPDHGGGGGNNGGGGGYPSGNGGGRRLSPSDTPSQQRFQWGRRRRR